MPHTRQKQSFDNQQVLEIETLIIGAGVSGIGAAIRLQKEGMNDFLILEKKQDLGGSWRDNTYPGCACDVPSALYSYSFAQNPNWTRAYARQPEILEYVRDTAQKFGVLPAIRFDMNVEEAVWDEISCRWEVRTNNGVFHAQTLISCAGYLHEPIIPNLKGLDAFKGEVFHSSRWNHDANLAGKRVAVIGTGASAIQFVPKLQPLVSELKIFQRTPQWVLGKYDRRISEKMQNIFNWPFTLNTFRQMLYNYFELFGFGFRRPKMLSKIQDSALINLHKVIKDPELRKKLTPDYTIGCKRVLMSNKYYPALAKPNVEVLATGVKEIKGNVVVGSDGCEKEVDTIILGTGFHVTDMPMAHCIRVKDGKSLAETWQGSPQAYKGTTVSGFPNLFIVLGPNLGIGHNSAFVVIESQLNYIMGALKSMKRKSLKRIEVKAKSQEKYNGKIQKDLQSTVWNTGGCTSYYIDANGKNSIGFPWSTYKMRKLLDTFDLGAYHT